MPYPEINAVNYEKGIRAIDIYQAEQVSEALCGYLDELLESDCFSSLRSAFEEKGNAFDLENFE